MRKIKFRGNRIDNGQQVYGFHSWDIYDRHYISMDYSPEGTRVIKRHEIDPKTVVQYTGVKDKNKKSVYFGDYGKLYFKFATDEARIEMYKWGYVKGSFSQGLWLICDKEQIKSEYSEEWSEIKSTTGKSKLAGYRFEILVK